MLICQKQNNYMTNNIANLQDFAIKLLDAGYNVMPVKSGAKNPHECVGGTHQLFDRIVTKEEVLKWFQNYKLDSIGLVNGITSQNLVTIDFDEVGFYDDWYSTLTQPQKDLVATMHKSKTRSGGEHLRFKTISPQPTIKLAQKKVDGKVETIVEVRGDRSYALIPPTNGYTEVNGDLFNLPIIEDIVYLELLETLKKFDEISHTESEIDYQKTKTDFGINIWDCLDKCLTFEEMLLQHNWKQLRGNYWLRPDKKDRSVSATLGYKGLPLFYVFSSNAHPFEGNKAYTKFAVYTLLYCNGDKKMAMKELGDKYAEFSEQLKANNSRFLVPDIYRERTIGDSPEFAFLDFKTFIETDYGEITWLVDNLCISDGFSIIVSKPKIGKSTLIRQMALSVAQGKDFLGRKTTQGHVIYVSFEEPIQQVQEHFKQMGVKADTPMSVYASTKKPPNLDEWLIKEIKKTKPVLIIIDTLFRYVDVGQINDYTAVTNALAPLLNIAREYKTHVMGIHHANKHGEDSGNAVLGSTSIFGTVDTLINLYKKGEERTITTEQRYGVGIEKTLINIDSKTRMFTLGLTKYEADLAKIQFEILELLKNQKSPVTEDSIVEAITGQLRLIRSGLRNLVTDNKIQRVGSGVKGNPFFYSQFLVPTNTSEQENEKIDLWSASQNKVDEDVSHQLNLVNE